MAQFSAANQIAAAFNAVNQTAIGNGGIALPDFHKELQGTVAKAFATAIEAIAGGEEALANTLVKPLESLLKSAGVKQEGIDRVTGLLKAGEIKVPIVRSIAVILMLAATYPLLFTSMLRTLGIVMNKPTLEAIRPADIGEESLHRLLLRRGLPAFTDAKAILTDKAIKEARDKVLESLDSRYGVLGIPKDDIETIIEANKPILGASDWLSLYRRGLVEKRVAEVGLVQQGYSSLEIAQLILGQTPQLGLTAIYEADNRGFLDLFTQQVDWYKREGLGDGDAYHLAKKMKGRLPGLLDIHDWTNRGAITQNQAGRLIKALGYRNPVLEPDLKSTNLDESVFRGEDALTTLVRSSAYQLPTVTDLVQFAVKEAFNFKVADRFGQYDEYPGRDSAAIHAGFTAPFKTIAPKIANAKTVGQFFTALHESIGVTEPHMLMQWAQHWNLPAPGQVFDMFFRRIISKGELNDYLRAADYSSFWRDKLLGIQYHLPTRTDLEAMLNVGVIGERDVTEGLELLGYKPEDADNLTDMIRRRIHASPMFDAIDNVMSAYRRDEITAKEAREILLPLVRNQEYIEHELTYSNLKRQVDDKLIEATGVVRQVDEARDLAKLDILRGFRTGLVKATEAVEMLTGIGFTTQAADFLIQRETLTKEIDKRDDRLKLVRKQFIAEVITANQARQQLVGSGFDTATTEALIADMVFELDATINLANKRDKHATAAQLEKWYKAGIIDTDGWLEGMYLTGATDFVIVNTLREIMLEMKGA